MDLKSPVIVGSSELSTSLGNIEKMEKSGAGAVILKSILEEEIFCSAEMKSSNMGFYGVSGRNYDYVKEHLSGQSAGKYLEYIRSIKERFSIPVIASINCCAFGGWVNFVREIKDSGCDAVELNFFNLPCDMNASYDDTDRLYSDTLLTLNRITDLPMIVKIGNYFTDMAKFVQRLSMSGVSAINMFGRMPDFDIDINSRKILNQRTPGSSTDLSMTLMWTTLLSKRLQCDISASGGIYSSEDVIKLILAGAGTVQTVSCLYENGIEYIGTLNGGLLRWMEENGYNTLDDFRGQMAVETNSEAKQYARLHFIKGFANIR